MQYDVVIMGSGAAGLTAALVAAKAGNTVAVLEKANHFGGTTAISGGGIWIPVSPQAKAEGVDEVQGYYYYPPLSIEAFTQLLEAETNATARAREGALMTPDSQP